MTDVSPRRRAFVLAVTAAAAAGWLAYGPVDSGVTRPVPGAPNCPMTPTDSFWHADVPTLPMHPQSAGWVSSIGTAAKLRADFGAGTWNGGPIGIRTPVGGTQPRVPVTFDYAAESDPGPYPVPPDAPIEGGANSTGDRHMVVVDRDACRLWELYSAYPQNGGTPWTAGSGATWELRSNAMRPAGWTSADAAGLSILPGLVRRDEVAAGEIDHAVRFTAPRTANAYVWPASHKAAAGGVSDPPMGAWFRLNASFRHQRLLGRQPGDPPDSQEARHGAGRQRLVVVHERRARSGVERHRSQRTADSARVRLRGGRRVVAAHVDRVLRGHDDPADDHHVDDVDPHHDDLVHDHPTAARRAGHQPRLGVEPGRLDGGQQPHCAGPGLCRHPWRSVCGRAEPHQAVGRHRPRRLAQHRALVARRRDLHGRTRVSAPAGRTVTVRLREYSGSTLVRSRTVTDAGAGAWQQLSVTSLPANGGTSISIDVVVSVTAGGKAQVDNVSLSRP